MGILRGCDIPSASSASGRATNAARVGASSIHEDDATRSTAVLADAIRLTRFQRAAALVCMATGGAITGATSIGIGGVVLLCIGLLPLILSARTMAPAFAAVGGLVWALALVGIEATEAVSGAGIQQFVVVPLVVATTAAMAACLSRRFGFNPFLVAVLWLAVEWVAIGTGIASEGVLGRTLHDHPMFGAIAVGLGSLQVALLLTLVTVGAATTLAAIILEFILREYPAESRSSIRRECVALRRWGSAWHPSSMPRAPPVRL